MATTTEHPALAPRPPLRPIDAGLLLWGLWMGCMFGVWQQNVSAGAFMGTLAMFLWLCIRACL